jgi:hypothetical protein
MKVLSPLIIPQAAGDGKLLTSDASGNMSLQAPQPKITVSSTQPSTPAVNDIWIQIP